MTHLYIFNEDSIAGGYGVGSYIRELSNSLAQSFKLHIVTLFSNNTMKEVVYMKNNITYLDFPVNVEYLHYLNEKKIIDLYYTGIVNFLRVTIPPSKNIIFQFNYNKHSALINLLKKNFPSAITVLTLHSMSWCFMLKGNSYLFKKTLNDYNYSSNKNNFKNIQVVESFQLENDLFTNVDRIICLSHASYDVLIDIYKIDKKKLILIPNGLEDKFVPISLEDKMTYRRKYHIDKNTKVFICAGRIEKNKGILYLIKAFKKIIMDFPNCLLYVVGDGQDYYKECLKESFPINGKIIFTGKLDQKDLYSFYQIADAGIIPSLHEQSSYTAIEMMMFGLNILSSNGYGLREMFEDEKNAWLIDIPNIEEEYSQNIFSVISKFLTSGKYNNLPINARKTYEDKYNLKIMQNKTMHELETLF